MSSNVPTTSARAHDVGGPSTAHDGSGLRWGIAAFLALLLVVSAVLIVLAVVSLRPRAEEAQDRKRAESAAVEAAQRFTVQLNTYDSASIGSYEKSVSAMLSPKYRVEFSKAIDQLSDSIVKGKMASKGEVLASAVGSLDADSAQVLVVADASAKTLYDENVARHFRWQVSLVKIDDKWLVDKYEPVA